jgi:trimeric autotransporter adhesin
MKNTSALVFLICLALEAEAQNIGINTSGAAPHPSAILDVSVAASPTNDKKGILFPRVTQAERLLIAGPAEGLFVYQTDDDSFWYFDGVIWRKLGGGSNEWLSFTTNGF